MTKEQAEVRAKELEAKDGKIRVVYEQHRTHADGTTNYGTQLYETALEKGRRINRKQMTSGYARAWSAAHRASGEGAKKDRAVRARKKAYLAEVFKESPNKRHYLDGIKSVVVLSDIQIPFEDPLALHEAVSLIGNVKPDAVILNGDIIDCYLESSFLKDPKVAFASIPETHTRIRNLMAQLDDVPHKYWLGGNHEERWKKTLWAGTKESFSIVKAHEEASGRPVGVINTRSSFVELYDVAKYGFEYHEYGHRLYLAEGNLAVTHGKYISRHSAQAAKRTWEWLGKSCIVGHTHRLGSYLITQDGREHGAWENGCLCLLEPEYDDAPNWQQGFSVVHIDGPEFHVIQVPIVRRNNKPVAVYNG